jgi:hypothetical protein
MQVIAQSIPKKGMQDAENLQVFAFMDRYFSQVKSMIGNANASTSFK